MILIFREVIEKKPEEFKIACLRDIKRIFPSTRSPFYSGFGNRVNVIHSFILFKSSEGSIFLRMARLPYFGSGVYNPNSGDFYTD